MFSSSLRAFLAAIVSSAVTVSAAPAVSAIPSLTIKSSAPNVDVDGLENLRVTTTIVNTGGETLKLLNDPRGVLSSFPENTFAITDAAGSRPSFNGAKVKYSPTYAAGLHDPSVYTILIPGASIDVTHDLSVAYDFTRSGAGGYSIEPSSLFIYVDADGTPKHFNAIVEGTAKVKLSGNLAVPRVHNKRASFNGCSSDQQSQINTAADNAKTFADKTHSYIKDISSGTPRYTRWFGTYDDNRRSTVEEHFERISSSDFSDFTYDCTCTQDDIYAYVYPDEFGTIYLCGAFWRSTATGSDTQGGTLIHETSHFTDNGGTKDYVYGQAACKELAGVNPDLAISNADSHQYFAENNPADD